MTLDEQLALLRRGTTDIISEDDLRAKLALGRPLRVKLGVDPTAKDVTLGWAVVLRKLRDFQRLGHTACLVIGDFTAMIGDPSGKSKTRKQLTPEEVQANVEAVKEKVFQILDPAQTEISFNKDWLGKMAFEDVIRLCSRYTVARILERDDFAKRLQENRPIAMHEILYPLCQGMDSVELVADVEIGGNDQMFNNLVGRNLMAQYGQEPQVVLLCPLLVGTDGKEKMSQSLGNYVSINDDPVTMTRKIMEIKSTDVVMNWFELCTDISDSDLDKIRNGLTDQSLHPIDAKRMLARAIVTLYHGDEDLDARRYYSNITNAIIGFPDFYNKGPLPVGTELEKLVDAFRSLQQKPTQARVAEALVKDSEASSTFIFLSKLQQDSPIFEAIRALDEIIASQKLNQALSNTQSGSPIAQALKNFETATLSPKISQDISLSFQSAPRLDLGAGIPWERAASLSATTSGVALVADIDVAKLRSAKQAPNSVVESVLPNELLVDGKYPLAALIKDLGLAPSNGQARKLMQAGAVSLDEDKVTDGFAAFAPAELDGRILRVGKHQYRKLRA
jgi:tyrosyl-tRNA synthetase